MDFWWITDTIRLATTSPLLLCQPGLFAAGRTSSPTAARTLDIRRRATAAAAAASASPPPPSPPPPLGRWKQHRQQRPPERTSAANHGARSKPRAWIGDIFGVPSVGISNEPAEHDAEQRKRSVCWFWSRRRFWFWFWVWFWFWFWFWSSYYRPAIVHLWWRRRFIVSIRQLHGREARTRQAARH